ncbi:MAG TPA: hypothetical protein VEW48_18155 [Thermoanaerobaculia bacterium]|nr:hypothetical protein [Thermoanaerobaculia bacterium]
MTGCVERQILNRFVAGTASGRERRQVVRHLVAGCGPCAAAFRSAFRPAIEAGAYDGALARMATWTRDHELARKEKWIDV